MLDLPPLAGLMDDPGVDTTGDAQLLAGYLRAGHTLPPLPMSIGDPYLLGVRLPAGLAAYEQAAPPYLAGYSRTPAGLPEARRSIAAATVRSEGLDRHATLGVDIDLHLTSGTGTRGIMGDFARHLLGSWDRGGPTPVVLCATPSWDYAGVFEPLGLAMEYWPLRAERGWLPDLADLDAALARIDADASRRLALVVVNAQHNPTGCGWPRDVLAALFAAATSRGAGILLDDAYRLVVTDDADPVSAPAALLEHLAGDVPADAARRWCRVESFGKAFACNDWGLGSVMAHPETLRGIARHTIQWAFPRGARRQWAMARWLADPACGRYLAAGRAALGHNRSLWAKSLVRLGWPRELTAVGTATPYFLVAVPPAHLARPDGEGVAAWRQELLDRTGLLFSYASITLDGTDAAMPFLRAYLGGGDEVVVEAIRRLEDADVRYE